MIRAMSIHARFTYLLYLLTYLQCLYHFVGKLYGNYLITAYLAVKLLYLGNAIGQLFLLDAFLKIDYHLYGVQVIAHLYGVQVVERLIRGQDWGYSERFPRVTLCEFEIRHQSRVHQYVVQCALTINLFQLSGSVCRPLASTPYFIDAI